MTLRFVDSLAPCWASSATRKRWASTWRQSPDWPEGHAPKVPVLIDGIERRAEFATVKLAWASGLMLVVRHAT
jgi:hypothetical protein